MWWNEFADPDPAGPTGSCRQVYVPDPTSLKVPECLKSRLRPRLGHLNVSGLGDVYQVEAQDSRMAQVGAQTEATNVSGQGDGVVQVDVLDRIEQFHTFCHRTLECFTTGYQPHTPGSFVDNGGGDRGCEIAITR